MRTPVPEAAFADRLFLRAVTVRVLTDLGQPDTIAFSHDAWMMRSWCRESGLSSGEYWLIEAPVDRESSPGP